MNWERLIFGCAVATIVIIVIHFAFNFKLDFTMPDFGALFENARSSVMQRRELIQNKFQSNEDNLVRQYEPVHNANNNDIYSEENKITENLSTDNVDVKKLSENKITENQPIQNGKYRLIKITKPLSPADCKKYKDKLGITNCTEQPDYWAKAVQMCGGKDKMANDNDLLLIANEIYEANILSARNSNSRELDMNIKTARKYFGTENVRGIWSSDESTGKYVGNSHWRYFWGTSTGWRGNGNRSSLKDAGYAICK